MNDRAVDYNTIRDRRSFFSYEPNVPAHRAFLEAILAAPEQDAPRLVYADWLEERGDPRGQFIRLQIAADRCARQSHERHELEAQARALLDEYEEEWIGDILRNKARSWFRRGFVEKIIVPAMYLQTYAGRIWDREPVVSVEIRELNNYASAIATLPELKYLRRLSFGIGSIDDEAILPLVERAQFGPLEVFTAWHGKLGDESAIVIANSPMARRLRILDLSNNLIQSRGGQALARSPYLQHIQSIRLYRNRIGIEAAEELRARFGSRLTL